MCDGNVSILRVSRGRRLFSKSLGRLDREGIGSRKGLRLILAVWDLKSVEGFPREGSNPSLGIAGFFDRESNRAKSGNAMSKSIASEWPTRAVSGCERHRLPPSALIPNSFIIHFQCERLRFIVFPQPFLYIFNFLPNPARKLRFCFHPSGVLPGRERIPVSPSLSSSRLRKHSLISYLLPQSLTYKILAQDLAQEKNKSITDF
jgi:hypothetical protein